MRSRSAGQPTATRGQPGQGVGQAPPSPRNTAPRSSICAFPPTQPPHTQCSPCSHAVKAGVVHRRQLIHPPRASVAQRAQRAVALPLRVGQRATHPS